MKTRTPLERMNFSYSIAKKWIEEQGNDLEEIDPQDKIQASILKFIVIRDFPFLKEDEVQKVIEGIKTIIDLAIGENEMQTERNKYVFS